jgi:acyl-coenzyme A thioesterase 13
VPDLTPDDPRLATFGHIGFDCSLAGMTLDTVEPGRAVVRLPVTNAVCNPVGTLHGGAIATLVDDAGTIALMTTDAESRPGVTTDLSVSYLSAAPLGDVVLAEARTLKAGRTLAFVEVAIRNAQGKLLAQGRMTKFMGR